MTTKRIVFRWASPQGAGRDGELVDSQAISEALARLKKVVARVQAPASASNENALDQPTKYMGTAFLVTGRFAITAKHTVEGETQVELEFTEWPDDDRTRQANVINDPAALRKEAQLARVDVGLLGRADVAILKLDRPAPNHVQLQHLEANLEVGGAPANGAPSPDKGHNRNGGYPPKTFAVWTAFGYPEANGGGSFSLVGLNQVVADPNAKLEESPVRLWQLKSDYAQDSLHGLSGSPCMVGNVVGAILSKQLEKPKRVCPTQPLELQPALCSVYAVPLALLGLKPIVLGGALTLAVSPPASVKHGVEQAGFWVTLLRRYKRRLVLIAGIPIALAIAVMPVVAPWLPLITTVALSVAALLLAIVVVDRAASKVDLLLNDIGLACVEGEALLGRWCTDGAHALDGSPVVDKPLFVTTEEWPKKLRDLEEKVHKIL